MKRKIDPKDFPPPRIVIKFQNPVNIPTHRPTEIGAYFSKNNLIDWRQLVQRYQGITIRKLFDSFKSEELDAVVDKAKERNPKYKSPEYKTPEYKSINFHDYFAIDCPYEVDAKELCKTLRNDPTIEVAYVESPPVPPPYSITGTNPFAIEQGYLNPASEGINATYAHTKNGGCGESNVQFIDIEYAWILDHEDLKNAQVNFLWGDQNRQKDKDHGTSVLGIILMQDNDKGGVGIAPLVRAGVVSQISPSGHNSIHNAILHATSFLNEGDVLLLEVQALDPITEDRYWPSEIEPAIFDAIAAAVHQGIVVVEAAANGDDNTRGYDLAEFQNEDGLHLLDRGFRDSGAIIVGAASNSEDHGKCRTSNYGDRVDCFAWGTKVFTADDPANNTTQPPDPLGYTTVFGGTSSAAAIIAGVAIVVQSIANAAGKLPINPFKMRAILSDPRNGTDSPNRIGAMPDLKKIIDNVIPGLP